MYFSDDEIFSRPLYANVYRKMWISAVSLCYTEPKPPKRRKNMAQKKVPQAAAELEKKQTRFAFACVANILYIIPCLSCLAMGILIDGFSPKFIFAIVTMLLNLPASLIILNFYKKKSGRSAAIAICGVLLALHLVCCPVVGAWYIIMAPSFVLYCLIIAWSEIIVNH